MDRLGMRYRGLETWYGKSLATHLRQACWLPVQQWLAVRQCRQALEAPLQRLATEGGWTDAERSLAAAGGASGAPVGLGEHVLRAETAAIAAGVLLTSLRR